MGPSRMFYHLDRLALGTADDGGTQHGMPSDHPVQRFPNACRRPGFIQFNHELDSIGIVLAGEGGYSLLQRSKRPDFFSIGMASLERFQLVGRKP